jgi:hypothetical protein
VVGWERITCAAVAALMLGCAVGPVRGQAEDKVYPLHGVVVNGLTGKPVGRALVKSADGRLATMTDDEGRFRVELHVPTGAGGGPNGDGGYVDLQVTKPGYLPERGGGRIAIDSMLAETEVKRVLMPAGRISGQVSASGMEAAVGVVVQLVRRAVGFDGRYHWMPGQTSATNSRGEFHFSNLRPGLYSLTTAEWHGDEVLEPQRDAVRKEYPSMFLGNGTTLEGATKLHVGYGESARVELRLEAKAFYPVTIPLPETTGQVDARLLDKEFALHAFGLQYVSRERAVEGWLPDGAYLVAVSSRAEQATSAVVHLTVAGGSVRTKPVALGPEGRIEVRVHDERTKPEPSAETSGGDDRDEAKRRLPQQPLVAVVLEDDGAGTNGYDMNLRGVDPGRHPVMAQGRSGDYVAAMSSGGVDLLRNPLVVSDSGSADPIDVTLRDDTASVVGAVTGGTATLARNYTIFFVPTDARGQYSQSVSETDGTFSVKDLVPGSYRAFAVSGVEGRLPFREADAMQPLQGKGIAVTVAPNQTVELDVPLLDVPLPEETGMEERDVEM